jgi:uncharacterized protein (TIGR04255 family)
MITADTDLSTICYKKNFLKEVIARIDLVSPVEAIGKELPKTIAKAALKIFPIDEPKPAFTQEFLFSAQEMLTRKKEFTEWNFYGTSREKRLAITAQALFVTYLKYEKYEKFREEFCAIVDTFFATNKEAQPSRLGLRYIDELKLPGENPLDWNEYISPELLTMFGYKIEGAEASRIFHNLEFAFPNFHLRFQFGMHNPDHPAPIRQRVFVLDFDAYYKGLIEPGDISNALDAYHTQIQRLFERSITDKTREVLNANP